MSESTPELDRPPKGGWRFAPRPGVAVVALAGTAAPLALALAGRADFVWALALAVAVGVVGVASAWPRAAQAPSAERKPLASTTEPGAGEPFRPPFNAMLDQLADPILLVEGGEKYDLSSRRFLFANAAARGQLRIQRQEGPLTTAIRTPEVLEAVDEALYANTPGEAVYEVRGVQDRFWRARALPVADIAGRGALALLVLRDETEIRRGERTRADFLANASHELRTPLASLTGFIETLRGHARDDPEAQKKFLGIMQVQAERMRRLIDDLMSLSRIEQAEHIPPSGAVDMSVAVIDVLDALAPLAKERCVSFETSLAPMGGAMVAADRDQILQVIQNLVENAIKYTPTSGRVVVEVAADLPPAKAAAPASDLAAHFSLLTPDHAAGRRYVALRVRDYGQGIARTHLPRLTERFYRVEGQKVRERPGTGLGLAIVKHIVNRHRGGLMVESAPGAGAMFTVYIPMAEAFQGTVAPLFRALPA